MAAQKSARLARDARKMDDTKTERRPSPERLSNSLHD
jgi:hypothetical protein